MAKQIRYGSALACVVALCALVFACMLALPSHAQAAKKKVWVVASSTESRVSDGFESDVDSTTYTDKGKTTYSYNKKGLLTGVNQSEMSNISAGKWTWKYDKKGSYKKSSLKWKPINGTKWYTDKYSLKLDKKKRVASVDGISVSYNKKGRCKAYDGGKFTYDSKGRIKKHKKPSVATTTITRNAKGDPTKCKHVVSWANMTAVDTFTNTYSNGRLTNWKMSYKETKGEGYSPVYTEGTFTWKQISVPKKLVAKVKAQQRWVVDRVMINSFDADTLPLVIINK